MDVVVKKGNNTIKKTGFSSVTVALKMEEVLKEHKHLCSDCCSTSCQGKRTMESDIITRGVRTLNRDFVFECLGYKKIKNFDDKKVFGTEISAKPQEDVYEPTQYHLCDEKVKTYVLKRTY